MATIELTASNIKEVVSTNDIVFIDFWASWCGPCVRFAPVFEAAAEKHQDIVFAKVDTEAQPDLAQAFQIMSIPTLMIFKESIGVFGEAGALPEEVLEDLITQVRALDMDEVRRRIDEKESA